MDRHVDGVGGDVLPVMGFRQATDSETDLIARLVGASFRDVADFFGLTGS